MNRSPNKFALKLTIVLTSFLWLTPFPLVQANNCFLGGTIPFDTTFAVGPNVYQFVSNNLVVLDAIRAGRDAWDITNAREYIGDWNGVVTWSDCSSNTGQRQLGAWHFNDSADPNYNCQLLVLFPQLRTSLAFVDYYTYPNCPYPQCGTGSILANLRYPFSTNPSPGEYDIQSVAAHEFGHVLGLGHAYQGICDAVNVPCSYDPFQETMSPKLLAGDTCTRDLAPHDTEDANALYSNGGGISDWSPSSR